MKKLMKILDAYISKYAYNSFCDDTEYGFKQKMKKVRNRKILTPKQKEEIISYYQKLTGKKVSPIYHEYFYSRTGKYSKEYMPVTLYNADIIGRANNLTAGGILSDKNFDDIILPMMKHPKSILKNINGYFYHEGRPISNAEAVEICQNIDIAIIKPSQGAKGGGIRRISIVQGKTSEGESTEELFAKYEKNFIIQECVQQHEQMSALNPTSINTLRIMTYRSGMDVYVVYAVVRIGRKGQVIDNQSKGGISTMINEDGTLCKYAFGVAGDDMIEKTDSGITLDGYQIPCYQKVLDVVKRAHYRIPFCDIVGWDIAIDSNGDPVLIEWNSRPGPSQTACGTGLGKYTEKIITEVIQRKNTRKFSL